MIVKRPLMRRRRLRVTYERRTRDEWMGRFGGGWQWEVGIQVGPTSAVLNLLVSMVRISWGPR